MNSDSDKQIVRQQIFSRGIAVPESLQSSHYPAFDGLRAVAILMVLFHHFGANRFLRGSGLFVSSETGVHVFFVLSGFLITTLLLKEKLHYNKIDIRQFYLRRILRIIPVAYLFLVFLVILNACFHLQIRPIDFISSFLFLKNFPVPNEPFTAHLWTLAVEVQFYLVFPLLLCLTIDKYFFLAITAVLIMPLVSILEYHHAVPEGAFIVHACMYLFWKGPVMILIGSIFATLMFKGLIKAAGKHAYFLSFILFILAITIHSRTFVWYDKYLCEYLSALLIGYVTCIICSNKDMLSTMLSLRALAWLGNLSYSLYIWQELFIGINLWQPWLAWMNGWPLLTVVSLKFSLTLICALLSYYLIELRFLKLKKKFSYA